MEKVKDAVDGCNVVDFGPLQPLRKKHMISGTEMEEIWKEIPQFDLVLKILNNITVAINGKGAQEFLNSILASLKLEMKATFQVTGGCDDPGDIKIERIGPDPKSSSLQLSVKAIKLLVMIERNIFPGEQTGDVCTCPEGPEGKYVYREFLLEWNLHLEITFDDNEIKVDYPVQDSIRVCSPCCCGKKKVLLLVPKKEEPKEKEQPKEKEGGGGKTPKKGGGKPPQKGEGKPPQKR